MDITPLFDELAIAPNVEIVIALLPKMLGLADQASRSALFQRLDGIGEHAPLRFAEQQVNVLRHDDISVNAKPEIAAHSLQRDLENALGGGCQQQPPVIAGKRHEVAVSGFLKSF